LLGCSSRRPVGGGGVAAAWLLQAAAVVVAAAWLLQAAAVLLVGLRVHSQGSPIWKDLNMREVS